MGRSKRRHSASAKPRLLLRDWLISMVNSKKIPGLKWFDEKEGIVQIPWKHGSKHNFNEAHDSTLFREWAIHTNRYKGGESADDSKKWKANFRCALNSLKKHIQYEQEKSKSRGDDAYRLYRLLPCASNVNQTNHQEIQSSHSDYSMANRKRGLVHECDTLPLKRSRFSTPSGSSSGVSCEFEDDDIACNSDISSLNCVAEVTLGSGSWDPSGLHEKHEDWDIVDVIYGNAQHPLSDLDQP